MTLAATMPAELGCRAARPLLIYVRKKFGQDGVQRLCRHVGLEPEYFQESNWISYQTYLEMLKWLVSRAGDERAVYEQGMEAASAEAYGALYIIMRSFATPATVYRAIPSQAPRWSRTGTFIIRELRSHSAVIEFVNRPECPQHRLNCLSIQGQLAAMPTGWGLPPAFLEHHECQVDGAARCTYRLRWVPRPSFGVMAFLAGAFLTWGTLGGVAGLDTPVPAGLALTGVALLLGACLDSWKVLRENRHIAEMTNASLEASLEDVESALEAVRRRNEVLESLREFSTVAAAADSQQPLVRRFLEWVSKDLGYQRCGFLLADPRSGILRWAESRGLSEKDVARLHGFEALINAEALQETTREVLSVREALLEPRADVLARHFDEAVVLSHRFRVVGVLVLGGPATGSPTDTLHYGLHVSTAHLGSALMRLNEMEMVDDAFMGLPTALAILDEDFHLLHANPAVAALLAPTGDAPQVEDQLLTEALLMDLRDVLNGAPTRSRDIVLGGRLVHASTFELPPGPTGGKRVGIALTDIEERESLVRQLVQSEKLASIGLLASGIAHQLNNPLFGIMGLAEAILDEDDMERIRAHARKLLRYGEVSADIIRDLSRYARAARTMDPSDPVDVNQVLDEAVDLVRYAGLLDGVEIERDFREVPNVWASFQEILQVFVNLIHNASDALEGKGSIRLATTTVGGHVEAVVADNGPGIAPEHLSSLFDPFFTTKPVGRGTGLGLAVVQRIVSRYNGAVRVESTPGQGTTFRVRLPVAGGEANPARPPSPLIGARRSP